MARQLSTLSPPQSPAFRAASGVIAAASARARAGDALGGLQLWADTLERYPGEARLIAAAGDYAREFGLTEEACRFYQIAATLAPDDLQIANNLALAHRVNGRYNEAFQILKPAVELAADVPQLWCNLGITVADAGDADTGLMFLREAERLASTDPNTLVNLGEVLSRTGDHEGSLRYLKRGARALPKSAQVRLNLGFAELRLGKLKDGWAKYEARLDPSIPTAAVTQLDLPIWRGEPARPGELLVCGEQGIGDEVLFSSLLPDLERNCPGTVVECEPRLVTLFERSFPGLGFHGNAPYMVGAKRHRDYRWLAELPVQPRFRTFLGSLPGFWRQTPDSFPQRREILRPHAVLKQQWGERVQALGRGLKVGISWRSGALGSQRLKWYLALEDLLPVLKMPGCIFVDCQYDDSRFERQQAMEQHPVMLHRFEDLDQKNDIEGTLAMMSNLDVVISVGTTVRCLAAAAGTRTLLMSPYKPWTALGSASGDPLQPAVESVVSSGWADWGDIVRRVQEKLEAQLQQSRLEVAQ